MPKKKGVQIKYNKRSKKSSFYLGGVVVWWRWRVWSSRWGQQWPVGGVCGGGVVGGFHALGLGGADGVGVMDAEAKIKIVEQPTFRAPSEFGGGLRA